MSLETYLSRSTLPLASQRRRRTEVRWKQEHTCQGCDQGNFWVGSGIDAQSSRGQSRNIQQLSPPKMQWEILVRLMNYFFSNMKGVTETPKNLSVDKWDAYPVIMEEHTAFPSVIIQLLKMRGNESTTSPLLMLSILLPLHWRMTYIHEQSKGNVIPYTSLLARLGSQVGEPCEWHPVFVEIRVHIVEEFVFLTGHKACTNRAKMEHCQNTQGHHRKSKLYYWVSCLHLLCAPALGSVYAHGYLWNAGWVLKRGWHTSSMSCVAGVPCHQFHEHYLTQPS